MRNLLSFLAVSTCLGVILAGLSLPALGAGAATTQRGVDLLEALPAEFEDRPLAEPTRVEDREGGLITEFFWQNRHEVALGDVSEPMRLATLAVEDHRFYEHGPVDLQGIARAAAKNVVTGSREGGSTLTQQYVKNVLVQNSHAAGDVQGVAEATEQSGGQGYARKLREMKIAAAVEKSFSKDEILERYLNINSYSGSPNAYGVEAAAQQYWSVSADELSVAQAATLAGIVRNPSKYNPQTNPEETLERRDVVLAAMKEVGFIDEGEYEDATTEGLDLDESSTPQGCTAAGDMAYFCDYVQREALRSPALGGDAEERRLALERGGLTIRTSIEPDLQERADEAVKARVPVGDASGAGQALVSMDTKNGDILAMAQNTDYDTAEDAGAGRTSVNYSVDRADGGGNGFQPGSTWKPFVLAQWLKEGRGLGTSVNSSGNDYRGFSTAACDPRGYAAGGYNPRNAGDSGGASGRMSVLDATRKSVNKGYADMVSQLDMCGIRDTADALGVHAADGNPLADDVLADGTQRVLYPSSILGTSPVSPLTMASAYTAFAGEGTRCAPRGIIEVTGPDGKELDLGDAACEEALDPAVARQVAYALTQTFEGGTTSGLGIGVPAAAKTGTTNFEVGASWLVGFTSGISTAVWTGDPSGTRDWRTNTRGSMPRIVYGDTMSGPTWQTYMRGAAPAREAAPFPRPRAAP